MINKLDYIGFRSWPLLNEFQYRYPNINNLFIVNQEYLLKCLLIFLLSRKIFLKDKQICIRGYVNSKEISRSIG